MKRENENAIPRWFLYGYSIVVLLMFLEFQIFQVFRVPGSEWEVAYEYSNLLILLLPIPFIAFVMVPLVQRMNNAANKRPILIRIDKNKVVAKRLNCEAVVYECTGEFSQDDELISDVEKLAEPVSTVIQECMSDYGKIMPSPYVVFTANKVLSQVQRQAAEKAIYRAGALDVKYMEECHSDAEAWQFVCENPTSFNLA